MGNYKEKLHKITTLIFDYDGVMSDGKVWVLDPEHQIRSAHVKDGYALHHAVKKGFRVAVISGGKGECIRQRMAFLGVHDVFLQVPYKKAQLEAYMAEHGLKREEVLYMGDDIPDYEVMQMAGVSACPADAAHEIREVADYVSHIKGGEGCVRDIVEQVMRSQNLWFDEAALHW